MLTAACYIRVSTDDQTEYSPESQLKLIRDYAKKNDICLLEDYIFQEDGGKSGKKMDKRAEFLKLIAEAKKKPKPFDIILVWKFSRFARNQEESIVVKSLLKKIGISVISISETIPEGPFGSLIERIIEWSDEYYSINLAEEVKRGMKERASRGEPVCPPPIGYLMEDGKYFPDPESAPLIKNIFHEYLNGMGCATIARKYSNLGVKTRRGNPPDNRYIEYILRNPVYIGKIRWSLDGRAASKRDFNNSKIMIVDGEHEPIIEESVFYECQKKLDETKKRYGKFQRRDQPVQFMLKGLVKCDSCGATLVSICTKSHSIQCHNYNKGQCTVSHSITVKKANDIVLDYLQKAAFDKNFDIKNIKKRKIEDKTDYSKILRNEENRLSRIKEAYQSGIDTLEEYQQNKKEVMENISRIKEIIKSEECSISIADKAAFQKKITKVLNIITDNTQTEKSKNEALRTIIEKIVFIKSLQKFEFYFYE